MDHLATERARVRFLRGKALTRRSFEVVDRIAELERPGYRFRRVIRGIFISDQISVDDELDFLRREREQLRRMIADPDDWWRTDQDAKEPPKNFDYFTGEIRGPRHL